MTWRDRKPTYDVEWHPFDTYPYGREALYYVPPYEHQSELLGRSVTMAEQYFVAVLLMRQTFDGPPPTHWAELPNGPSTAAHREDE